jgi:RNA polymerase sporulation-specific sigma factor
VKALEAVLEEYKDIIRAKAGVYFILGADKDDIIQEGMIGLVKAYNSFDESRGASFKTYANICIDRQIINAMAGAGRKKHSLLNAAVEIPESRMAGPSSNPEDALIYNDYVKTLRANKGNILSAFEHKVLLKLMEGKDYKVIASELQKSPKSIDNAIQRIRQKIKSFIE